MDLQLLQTNKFDTITTLCCISDEYQLYIPAHIHNSPIKLKANTVVWKSIGENIYNVYELKVDIDESNKDDFINSIEKYEEFLSNIILTN